MPMVPRTFVLVSHILQWLPWTATPDTPGWKYRREFICQTIIVEVTHKHPCSLKSKNRNSLSLIAAEASVQLHSIIFLRYCRSTREPQPDKLVRRLAMT